MRFRNFQKTIAVIQFRNRQQPAVHAALHLLADACFLPLTAMQANVDSRHVHIFILNDITQLQHTATAFDTECQRAQTFDRCFCFASKFVFIRQACNKYMGMAPCKVCRP